MHINDLLSKNFIKYSHIIVNFYLFLKYIINIKIFKKGKYKVFIYSLYGKIKWIKICMWSNLITCKIIYDRNGKLTRAKERFNVKYPIELKQNIIKRNMRLLHNSMPSYNHQILKAVSRNDKVNLGNRVTAFMDSYFDVIFALNEITHP